MARIGLLIYLMIVTLAGPLLCPCSAPQFLGSFLLKESEGLFGGSASCPCCPKLPTLFNSVPGGERQPAPPPSPCSCPSHELRVLALLPHRLQQARQSAFSLPEPLQPDVLLQWTGVASLTVAMAAPEAEADRSFLNPKELLHVFHFLRC